jgi:mannose-1-phosphate guanylyltransferase
MKKIILSLSILCVGLFSCNYSDVGAYSVIKRHFPKSKVYNVSQVKWVVIDSNCIVYRVETAGITNDSITLIIKDPLSFN